MYYPIKVIRIPMGVCGAMRCGVVWCGVVSCAVVAGDVVWCVVV